MTPITDWGKDHWSLLGYLMTRAADFTVNLEHQMGTLYAKAAGGRQAFSVDREHLRCNPTEHPMLQGHRIRTWKDEFGTRLAGYWGRDGSVNHDRQVCGHDDWDCIEDFEAAGFIETISLVNGYFRMTEAGAAMGARLMKFKATGGQFAKFELGAA